MGNMWAKKPLKEVMRENKRMINRAIRELDREKTNLERNEKKLIADIKKYAKDNQMVCISSSPGPHFSSVSTSHIISCLISSHHQGAVKTLAKDLVRTRNYVTKFIEMRSHLQGASLKLEVSSRRPPDAPPRRPSLLLASFDLGDVTAMI